MKFPSLTLETTLLLIAGCGLLLMSAPQIHLSLLDPDDNAYLWQRSSVLAALLIGYGTLLVILSVWSRRLALRGTSFVAETAGHASNVHSLIRDDLLPALRRSFGPGWTARGLLVVLCFGIIVRAYFLTQPVRYDEAYTFLNFVNGNLSRLFDYPYPNNHVLHTILVKLSTIVWGAHPPSIRIPAFLAGIASIPLMFCLARILLNERSGIFATVAMSVFPYLVLYSTIARGYSMIVFLTLALILVAALTAKTPSIAASVILSIIAALGLSTIPSMAFAVAGVYLWLACLLFINGNKLRRILHDFAIPCAIMTAGLAAVLYTPVILVSKGIDPLLNNEYVAAQPSAEFFSEVYSHLTATLADFSRDIAGPVLWIGVALMAIGTYSAARRRDWAMLLLLPSVLAGSGLLFLLKHAIPFSRTWIFLIPIALILANAGLALCVEAFSMNTQRSIHRGIVFGGACYAVFLISTNAILKYPDTGTFPEAPQIAGYLKPLLKNGAEIHASAPADYPTYFYLWYRGASDFMADEGDSDDVTKFVIVQKSNYLRENTIEEPVVKLIDVADAAVFRNVRDTPNQRKRLGQESGDESRETNVINAPDAASACCREIHSLLLVAVTSETASPFSA
ncbi:MAG: glycosyltransferase family 39 protein [Candidatus Binatia bacterium]